MEADMTFDYYYGGEGEQFRFFRIPKLLFEKNCFKDLSCESKLLYGMMLDRMALSVKSGWVDENKRIYIVYSINLVIESIGCSKDKARKLFSELEKIGLIEKRKRGQGRPDVIYVKNFARLKAENQQSENCPKSVDEISECEKTAFLTAENSPSRVRKNRLLEDGNSAPNDIDINNTKYINTILSHQSVNNINNIIADRVERDRIDTDGMDEINADIAIIRKNVLYDYYMQGEDDYKRQMFEELYNLIVDVVIGKRKTLKIGGTEYPHEIVRTRFLKLDFTHLEYVISQITGNRGEIKNMRAYMLAALYNAPATMSTFYNQLAEHDMYGGGWKDKGIV